MPCKHMVTVSRCNSGLDCGEYAMYSSITPWPYRTAGRLLRVIISVKGKFFDPSGIFLCKVASYL